MSAPGEHANSNLSDLTLAGLVHDLRNVFETLGEAADLLAGDERWAKLAATIERASEQGRRITESFRESARSFDFELILDNAIQSIHDFQLTGQHAPLEFHCHIEPGIRLAGRPGAWERVLVNLFLNAAHAMPQGGDVEVLASRSPGGIEIVVRDSGPGIPADILDRLFTPGFSTRHAHSGLGLSIVESIVSQHGGTVQAGNRIPGPGAEFVLRTPDLQIAVANQPHAVAGEGFADAGVDESL
ncbi:MAG: HAMP domain-containing sensor histidine kinase [Acidobacteria bacterium]|nr:HAMP domain-containing sensor histidine kinase [Acidobacteriota bacterium]